MESADKKVKGLSPLSTLYASTLSRNKTRKTYDRSTIRTTKPQTPRRRRRRDGDDVQQAGLTDGGAPELWNVTQPEKVKAIYRGYAEAGSDIITSNTFGGTPLRLKMHNLQDRVYEVQPGRGATCT